VVSKTKSALLRGVAPVVFGIAILSNPALAQTQSTAEQPGTGPIEGQIDQSSSDGEPAASGGSSDIVVTGSRLRSPNLESASPITVLSPAEIRQTGTTRVEDLVNSLPQVFAGQNSGYSNASTGTATINLRGLGSERNLVLVNGRRLMPGDPSSSASDINTIPGAIIKRVDVLTGGASSVYGADAVTGVVNFVMDTDFEGFRLDGQYSFYNHDNRAGSDVQTALGRRNFGAPDGQTADGGTVDVTAAFGTSFDDGRGHITAYAGYRKIDAVTQDRRDYSSCNLGPSTAAQKTAGYGKYNCGGSGTSANGTFYNWDSSPFQVGAGQTFIPGSTPYNFAPTNYFQRPDERYTAGFFANYEISDSIKPYAEFMFMDDRTVAQIAPSGNFGNTFAVNCDNPLLSAQQLAIVCAPSNLVTSADGSVVAGQAPFQFRDPVTGGTYTQGFLQAYRRNVEGGPRQDDLQHTSYRFVGGVRGDLGSAWNYDAFYQYGRTNFAETYFNDFSVSRLTNATNVITGPNGTPICRSAQPGGSDLDCVPYNIYGGGVSQEALTYLQVPGFQRGINTEQVANASISGSLGEYGVKSPWSTEGLGIVVGGEYRKEKLDFFSDVTFQTGDLAGQGAPTLPVAGSFNVKEVFTEVRLPIVSENFFHDLTITGGYRYSSYKNSAGGSFNTDTYKVEGEFAPIRDIRFRGGYNRAVRAPTVQDLFAPNRVALNGSSDPCAGFTLTAADTGCLAQGLAVGQFVAENPAAQYNGLIGGNVGLAPEIADTYTFGVVLQPTFLRGFALSVDYFNIKLDGAVSQIGQDTTLQLCTESADPFYCGLINRDQFGSLWRSENGYVLDTTQNIGGLSTKGIDVNASYTVPLGEAGNVGLSFVGTYLDEIVTDPGVSDPYDCSGLYGNICGTPNPKWRHQARASYTAPNGIGVSLRWRYQDGVDLDTEVGGSSTAADLHLQAVSYFDLSMTAKIGDNFNFRFGANNILDKQPPLTTSVNCPAGPCNGNTWPGVYDAIGRYIYSGVTLDF
jgi:outer membrane receptor protein involved in Fe transport